MNYSESMFILMNDMQKSINDNNRLDYFKNELLKILDKKEEKENTLSKSIQDYFNSINTTLFGIGIEKGRAGTIGEIRTWKDGKKYKKMPNGKWVRVYQERNRSAEISIARLKGKVRKAQSVDELMNIVMNNIHRFEDENGNILPIVEELKKEVAASKGKINIGKPSTEEQIKKFKADKRANKPYSNIKAENVKVGDKIYYVGKVYTVLSVEDYIDFYKEIQIGEKRSIRVKKDSDIKIVNNDYENEYGKRIKDVISKIESIKNSDKDIHVKIDELRKLKDDESMYFYQMLKDSDKNSSDDYYQQERPYYNTQYDNMVDKYMNPVINELWANTPEQLEKKQKEQEEKDKKKNALKNKLDSINNNYKYEYSDAEIKAAFDGVEKIQNEINDIKQQSEQLKKDIAANKSAMINMEAEYKKTNQVSYISTFTLKRELPEYAALDEKDDELRNKSNELHHKLISKESELNEYMDPIADYYLKMDWEKDSSIDNCKNINEVMDLIKSKDWYNEEGNKNLDLKGVDVECGKLIFKCMERIFAIFPERKGKIVSLNTNYSTGRTWAIGAYWSGITFNRYYWKNKKEFEDGYNKTEGSFHPKGTTIGCVVFHEYYHVITTKNDLARIIKNKVSKSLNLEDRKSGVKKDVLIAKGISEYATKNADEFGAEAFGECLNSPNPSAFAREVFKETIKHVKYLKEIKEI